MKLTAQAAERGSGGPCPVVTLDQAGFFLDVFQGFLRPNNNIPHPLPGDVIVLRDFRQGKIIVIVQIIELFLPRREKIPIKVIEHGHPIGLIFHGAPPFQNM